MTLAARHLAALLVLLAVLAGAACTLGDEGTTDENGAATPATTDSPDPVPAGAGIPAIVDEVEPSVVAILRERGEGSGVIYDPEGLVVTNAHVVARARSLQVQLADGTRLPAEVVAADPQTDLAVLRVAEEDLPAADFADELPEVGELAVAIGNPLGLENTVTAGIVSGLHRSVPAGQATAQPLVDLVQTDAAISPGNSGGALVDEDGDVIGINIAYLPPQATGAVSIGFAIPSYTVVDVVDQLIATGEVRHAFLGIQPGPLTPQLVERFELDIDEGVLVVEVVPGSPAAEAGLRPGDVLVELDGERLEGVADLLGTLRRREPGDVVELLVHSAGEEERVDVTLADLPDDLTAGLPDAGP